MYTQCTSESYMVFRICVKICSSFSEHNTGRRIKYSEEKSRFSELFLGILFSEFRFTGLS